MSSTRSELCKIIDQLKPAKYYLGARDRPRLHRGDDLGTPFGAGVPVLRALDTVGATTGNTVIHRDDRPAADGA